MAPFYDSSRRIIFKQLLIPKLAIDPLLQRPGRIGKWTGCWKVVSATLILIPLLNRVCIDWVLWRPVSISTESYLDRMIFFLLPVSWLYSNYSNTAIHWHYKLYIQQSYTHLAYGNVACILSFLKIKFCWRCYKFHIILYFEFKGWSIFEEIILDWLEEKYKEYLNR